MLHLTTASFAVALSAVASTAVSVGAQQTPNWNLVTAATSPPTRGGAAMVYDNARGECVLFGGRPDTGYYGDTWTFDGNDWTQHTPAAAPSPRYNAAVAFDTVRQRVVLFGGTDDTNSFGDTWEWDGVAWTQLNLPVAPAPRDSAAMAFDSNSGVCVLYGGFTSSGPAGDTWIFDGSQWRSTASGTAIGSRFGSAAFFGPAGRVQFVGRAAGSALAEGFEWRGTQGWARHPALDFAGATPRLLQDSARGLLVAPAPNPQVFDGTGWRAEQPEFAPNIGQNFAYDAARGALVSFGWWQTRGHLVEGFTWEYRTAPAIGIASAQAFGDGCAAPGVQPRYLAGVTGALPQLGSSAVVRSFSRDTSPSYLVVGTSRTTLANGMPLPFVHPLFRFGCSLQVRPDDALLMTRPVSTYAQATIAVPAQPALLGAVLYCQEVMAPTFDMFLSNGLELRAGW